MSITPKSIKDDISNIANVLSGSDFEIPSLWKCLKPAIFFYLAIIFWQLIVSARNIFSGGEALKNYGYMSVCMSVIVGFFISMMIFNVSAKYLSIPNDIRNKSLIIRIIRNKVKVYSLVWCGVVLLSGGLCIALENVPAVICPATQLVSLCLVFFFFQADVSRYDLSTLGAIISKWRNGN